MHVAHEGMHAPCACTGRARSGELVGDLGGVDATEHGEPALLLLAQALDGEEVSLPEGAVGQLRGDEHRVGRTQRVVRPQQRLDLPVVREEVEAVAPPRKGRAVRRWLREGAHVGLEGTHALFEALRAGRRRRRGRRRR